ncbi:MAG: pentapeptide repeat-containing protein [Bauldia sp.]|nr:pentapeptide repeat-containing protein [Bauldia sp.]
MGRNRLLAIAAAIGVALAAGHTLAQQDSGGLYAPSVWDLTIGLHATELPTEQFMDFACGTNGGPPSTVIADFADYATCRPEQGTGFHEVYFQYDDEYEYVARARRDMTRAALFQYTSVYSRPVIATALFDADGFMRGLRLVTDPRVDLATRGQAYTLGGFMRARYDGDWQCEDLPRIEGESAYQGMYIKELCTLLDGNVRRTVETHLYRRPGQHEFDRNGLPTSGEFESVTRYEEIAIDEVEDREARLAAIAAAPPPEADPLIAQALDCPGCDLARADLKRANLTGANLAGANLEGANLHAAILANANLAGANLRGANINRSILTGANLAGADLSGAMLYESRLDGANLAGATAVGLLAAHARLIRADLTGAIVADSDLTQIRMTNAVAVNASFARSGLQQAQLMRTDFTGAILDRAVLLDSSLVGATLAGATARIADFLGADLRDTDLSNVNFSGSRMTGAILARAIVDGAVFEGTMLPAGFTPP